MMNNLNLVNKKAERKLAIFIVAVIIAVFLTNLSAGLSAIFDFDPSPVTIALKAIIGCMFLLCIKTIMNRLNTFIVVFTLFSVLAVVVNVSLFPELNEYFISTSFTFFTLCLPPMLVCYILNDYSQLYKFLLTASYFVAFVMFVVLIFLFTGIMHSFNDDVYSMGLGYSCIIPAIMLSGVAVKNNKAAMLGLIVLVLSIVTLCSRGPLMGIGLYYIYYSIRNRIQEKKFVSAMLIVLTVLVAFVAYKPLLKSFGTFLENNGMQTRVTSTMTEDDIHMSGRNMIYEILIDRIRKDPYIVRGINAEWAVIGGYAHSIVLELTFQFGVIFGGIALVFIFYRVYKTLTFSELDEYKTLCIAFMFSSVPGLFVSDSLWNAYIFWMWMGTYSKIDAGSLSNQT